MAQNPADIRRRSLSNAPVVEGKTMNAAVTWAALHKGDCESTKVILFCGDTLERDWH